MDRVVVPAPIYEQLLARLVLLAENNILLAAPALIQLAEAVAIAVWVGPPVFLTQQLLPQMRMLLPLPVEIGEVRHGQHGRAAARRFAERRGRSAVPQAHLKLQSKN